MRVTPFCTECVEGVSVYLFSDAKPREDLAKDFVCGDLAGDGAEGGEGGAEVLRQEVGGDGAVEAVGDGGKERSGVAEGGSMAGVGHQGAGRSSDAGAGDEGDAEFFEAGTGLGGDFQGILVI